MSPVDPDGWPTPGGRIAALEVIGLLGTGGTSRVFLARDPLLDREVAVKVLDAPAGDPEQIERWHAQFLAEARATARLAHPGIVTIHGAGRIGDRPYLVLERLVGGTLRERLARGLLTLDEGLDLGVRAARTLAHVHRLGLTHRDVGPNNLWIGPGGEVRLLDLGLVSPSGERPAIDAGTPGYTPPERDRGAPEDGRADVFGLCATLCRAWLGRAPARIASGRVDRSLLARCPLPAPVVELLRAGLADDPAERPDADALADGLARIRTTGGGPAPVPREVESYGREAELAALGDRIARGGRLITLLGAPGVGKTHLARAALARLAPDRPVAFVDATEVRTADGLVAAVLRAFRVGGGRDPMGAAAAVLRGHDRLVLALDNLEQVVGPAGEVLGRWLAEAPELTVLGTSREPLGRPEEVRVRVDVLPVPEEGASDDRIAASPAVRLFVARAREVRPDLPVDPPALRRVAALARRLDGLPLALELTAARLGSLSLRALEEQVPGRLALADPGRRSRGDRHATLRDAIAASWEALDPAERLALARLSVFRAGFWLEGAAVVLAAPPSGPPAHALLAALAERSLLRTSLGSDGDLRYAMLPTIAEYAAERLADPEAAPPFTGPAGVLEAEARHGRWFGSFFDEQDYVYAPTDPWVQRHLEGDLDDVLAALERAIGRGDARIAVGAALTAHAIGAWSGREGLIVPTIARAAALPMEPRPAAVMAQVLARIRMVTFGRGAAEELGRAEVRCEAAGLDALAATVRSCRAAALAHEGRAEEAVPLARRALGELTALGHPIPIAVGWHRLGVALHHAGRAEEARQAFEACRARATPDSTVGASAAISLGILAKRAGRNEEAEALYRDGLARYAAAGDRQNEALSAMNLGVLLEQTGRTAEARAAFDRAATLARGVGAEQLLAAIRYNATELVREVDPAAAYAQLDEAIEAARNSGMAQIRCSALARKVLWLGQDGRFDEAFALAPEAVATSREATPRELAWALLYAGRVHQMAGDDAAADPLLQQALEVAGRADEESILAEVLIYVSEAHLRRREEALAEAAAARAEELARRLERRHLLGDALYARARVARAEGRDAEAEALEARSRECAGG